MSALLFVVAYFSGSIPFGVIITRVFAKKDVTAEGSGNIGATNVARVAGKKLGALVLVLDALKGALPVYVALLVAPGEYVVHVGVALTAFLGHVFPVWLKFKGGKGVATAMGVLVVLLPWSALAGFVVWGIVIATTRTSSIASLSAGVVAIIAAFFQGAPWQYPALAVTLLLAMVWTHRANISRLKNRTENKF
jgi:glycerol-3-phosphate acyltransferase PlsY